MRDYERGRERLYAGKCATIKCWKCFRKTFCYVAVESRITGYYGIKTCDVHIKFCAHALLAQHTVLISRAHVYIYSHSGIDHDTHSAKDSAEIHFQLIQRKAITNPRPWGTNICTETGETHTPSRPWRALRACSRRRSSCPEARTSDAVGQGTRMCMHRARHRPYPARPSADTASGTQPLGACRASLWRLACTPNMRCR